jgi:hypothetical protein
MMRNLVRVCLGILLGAVPPAPAFAECEPPEFHNILTGNPVICGRSRFEWRWQFDLAVAMIGVAGQPSTLAIFLGQGNGTFAPARTIPLRAVGGTQSGIAIGDLNRDGNPDIAVVSNFDQPIDILLGDGAGGFQEVPVASNTDFGATGLVMADLNGDGTFQSDRHLTSGSSSTGIAVTRFSGSNGPDLVIVNQNGTWVSLVNAFPVP